jgi:hypothetical protein
LRESSHFKGNLRRATPFAYQVERGKTLTGSGMECLDGAFKQIRRGLIPLGGIDFQHEKHPYEVSGFKKNWRLISQLPSVENL